MKIKMIVPAILLAMTVVPTMAEKPLWQGKGRIAISSDGNEHDHDDWSATPLSLAIIAAKGLQDKLTLYTYSDHIWGSNQLHPDTRGISAYDHMKKSTLEGADQFGYDRSVFVCAVDNAEVAYVKMMREINKSTEDNPLFIVAGGMMQIIGEALDRSFIESRKYVTVISHSIWNNNHADHPSPDKYWDQHEGWTFDEMRQAFEGKEGGSVKFIQIADQNFGADYPGLNTRKETYDWMKTSAARNNPAYKSGSWDWLYERMEASSRTREAEGDVIYFDPSDAGMFIYLFTGIEKTSPEMVRKILENPVTK